MAKTKQDYYNEGVESARMGDTRSPGGEWAMPVFGESGSWQGNAFAAGFRDEVKRQREAKEAVDFACTLESERTARNLDTVGETHAETLARVDVQLRVEARVAAAVKANPKWAEDALSKYGVPGSVIEHLNYLHRQRSTCTDDARRQRLLGKIETLNSKWRKRATAAFARESRA